MYPIVHLTRAWTSKGCDGGTPLTLLSGFKVEERRLDDRAREPAIPPPRTENILSSQQVLVFDFQPLQGARVAKADAEPNIDNPMIIKVHCETVALLKALFVFIVIVMIV